MLTYIKICASVDVNAVAGGRVLYNTACPGTGPKDFINPHNINKFIGCTVIHGEIRILPTTFYGFVLSLFYSVNVRVVSL